MIFDLNSGIYFFVGMIFPTLAVCNDYTIHAYFLGLVNFSLYIILYNYYVFVSSFTLPFQYSTKE